MFAYTARKGKESVRCIFDNMQDMINTMLRDTKHGWTISDVTL